MAKELHVSKHVTYCSGQFQGNRDSGNPANKLHHTYKYKNHCCINSILQTNI